MHDQWEHSVKLCFICRFLILFTVIPLNATSKEFSGFSNNIVTYTVIRISKCRFYDTNGETHKTNKKHNKTVTNNTVQLKLICLSFYVQNIHIKQKRGRLKTRMQYFIYESMFNMKHSG